MISNNQRDSITSQTPLVPDVQAGLLNQPCEVRLLVGAPQVRVSRMRFQTKSGTCGPASIVNALRCFGKRIAERRIWPLANTDEDGTDEEGMLNALTSLGYSTSEIKANTNKEAIWELNQALTLFPVILSVLQDKHWVTAIGKICDRYIIADPSRIEKSKQENGIYVMSRRELLKYWRHPNGEPAKFYGIVVRGHTK